MKRNVLCLTVAFLPYLLLCKHVQAECTMPSFESRNVVSSDYYPPTQSFAEGFILKFECSIGHKPVNSRAPKSVTCVENNWTNLELSCERKSCGSPPEFLNGRYNSTGILFGDTITPVCNTGYLLVGLINVRQCRDGGWDGRDPVCESVKCEAPPSIENGNLRDEPLESYDYLEVVAYACNRGFSLSGKSTLYCSEDGTFKPDPPKCVDGCPTPRIPNSVRIGGRAPPYKLDHFIEYSCIKDHVLMGAKEITCTADGWSPEPPKCIEPCSVPDFGRNVTLTDEFSSKIKFAHGSKVTFKCSSGYEAVGSTAHQNSVTCEETKWTKLLLICKALPTTTTTKTTTTTTATTARTPTSLTTSKAPLGGGDGDDDKSSPPPSTKTPAIVGGIFGAVVIIGCGCCIFFFFKKRSNRSQKVPTSSEEPPL